MRELKIGDQRFTKVLVGDEPDQSGACHKYYFCRAKEIQTAVPLPAGEFGYVEFQNGPVKEFGINGCHQEDLLAIVIDRLQHFQARYFAYRENALALAKLKEALHWLNHRTSNRVRRGVEEINEI